MAERRTYIVTGACGGIGRSVARVLLEAGHYVVLTDVVEPSDEVSQLLVPYAGNFKVVKCDITSEAEVEAMVANACAASNKLDGAVNCAGIEQNMIALADMDLNVWQRVINVNLTALFICLKYQIKAMLETGGGSIVNISSALGQVALPNGCEYVTSKHGVNGLTKSAALDYSRQSVRVNAVSPGVIRTPMHDRNAHELWMKEFSALMQLKHPIGRMGEADEVSAAVKWLLSDEASFVTGAIVAVDGGYTIE